MPRYSAVAGKRGEAVKRVQFTAAQEIERDAEEAHAVSAEVVGGQVRDDRDGRLVNEVDTAAGNILRWSALTEEKKAAWSEYRLELLDVPQQAGFPTKVTWPIKP